CLIGEYSAPLARAEFAAVVIQPVKPLDHIHRFPWLAGPDQGRWKAHGVERYVILAEKLDVFDVLGVPPPLAPIPVVCFGPFLRCRDVANGRVEPDIEHLPFKSGARHRYAPGEVARDAAISEFGGEPAFRQRDDKRRPAVS